MNTQDSGISITVLGSGTSHGVPMIGCDCEVCRSGDPHDKRTRPSVYIQTRGVAILIDTAPELRLQCIANKIDRADAVLFTHHHADHVTGLDDLRRFNYLMKMTIPLYGSQRTLTNLERMFKYAFEQAHDSPHSRPAIDLKTIDHKRFSIKGVEILPIPLIHGRLPVLGFRIGAFAYCTDCSEIPEDSFERLKGVEVLILDALRIAPHPAHFNLEQAVETAHRIGARRTYFTHITHQMGHEKTNADLPDGMALAHDGLQIEV